MSIESKIDKIRKVKRAEYGSFKTNLRLIGESWSTLLDLPAPIPPYKVALMYTVSKVIRAAHSFKEDNYIDAQNYLRKAHELQQEDGKNN